MAAESGSSFSFDFAAISHVRRDYRQDGCRSPRLAWHSAVFILSWMLVTTTEVAETVAATVAATVARCKNMNFNVVNYDIVDIPQPSVAATVATANDEFRKYHSDQRRSSRLSLRLSSQQLHLSIRSLTVTWPSDENNGQSQSQPSVAAIQSPGLSV